MRLNYYINPFSLSIMRKLFILIIIALTNSNAIKAQLEVKDTLLMAFGNEVFWSASSELEQDIYADFGKYGSTNLGDNNPSTCWAEGSEADGIHEYILMTVPENILSLKIRNGYQKNESLYYANNRPKTIELSLYAAYEPSGYVTESHNGFFISEPLVSTRIELEDKLGYQDIKTGFNWTDLFKELEHDNTFNKDQFVLQIKILDIYKGTKWNDACISDIKIIPNPYYDITKDEHGLLRVYDTSADTLFYQKENIYQAVEVSPRQKWIIFILMPSEIDNSRTDTEYKLYNTEKEEFIEIKDIYTMYGFIKKSGELYLEVSDKDFNELKIKLSEL